MERLLDGKIALVTGASRGIGNAVVRLFAAQGAEIFCCARSEKKLRELRDELSRQDSYILPKAIDLNKPSEIDGFFEFISEHTDILDIVVNAAGNFTRARIDEIDEADYDMVMNVNLKAPLLICRNSIPYMEKAGGGTIVNVSSLSGCFGLEKFPTFGSYNISKYGLWGLTEILALELKQKNIRVNQVSPSGVDTELYYRAVPPGVEPSLAPEDVANVILYLASDRSAPLTGENLRLFGK
jgi:NAD(P)-dependent dehydrogenase (short-subunit alcohol dehydrogenase family)